ncbi:uncharacterized protein APUU_80052S [Aspergillus puulaauensis]|uniref:Uncharacterized protein n=1 Tax=Aspergillus puulaauensis TaxID=1220207 RepID=A0A7R7XY97_9EURO|nr:uncharacterized protein APUU_80052S [Aspergillus puulaauensis]BCS29749.1 hypothetical protein APUU_80052S [Aspergillus puulaauensis]
MADYRDQVKGVEGETQMEVSGPADASGDAVEATTVSEPSSSTGSASSRPPSTTDAETSSHPQPRGASDPSDFTVCGATIFRLPTIETLDADGHPFPAGIDGSLWQLGQDTESCGHMLFARLWTNAKVAAANEVALQLEKAKRGCQSDPKSDKAALP